MRNLNALQIGPHSYSRNDHSTMFKHMKMANRGEGRDHYHVREGLKEDMPFICLIKADLESENQYIKGKIGGRDDDQERKVEMLLVEFEVYCDLKGKIFIEINSTDSTTTYEESLKLAHYCLSTMSHSSIELTIPSSGGNSGNKKGYYPQSAQNTGFFNTFDETFDRAVSDNALPEGMRDFFQEANYNLIGFNNKPKKKAASPKKKSNQK